MSKKTGKTLARERRDETISSLPVAYTGRGGSKKGSGGSSAGTTPDTLFSTSTVRIVGLVGEGEIGGIVGGLMGVYRNDVPIQNADGTFNFKGITCDFRTGTPDQPYMPGYPDVETARNIGVKVNQATPVVASVSDENVNRVRVTVFIPALFIQKNDGTYQSNTVNYRIAARWYNGQYQTLGDFSVTGKTTSGYYRQHELVLPKNTAGASAPWSIQVTRLSPDTDGFNNSQSKYTVQSDLIFYSITDIIDSKLTYPWSALVGMTAQTSQLGDDLGEFRTLVDGIKMMVPSNRDQGSRTYNGFWDGTFKEETADSPPWVLYLLMENDRFGLGEFLDTAGLDKVTLYEIGRYCDTLVDDGAGGREPRYTCNAEITTQEEAYDLLQLVAQIYHGMVYWSSGAVTSTWDAPRDAKFLATEANVVDGLFTYSSSARKARHTAALVRWHDPANLYRENIEFVELGEAIARYGYNPITIDLLGCTSRGQAHRHGLWTLLTETYETQVVKFQGGMEYALARPGDVVSVQDPQISNLDYGGRLLAGSTAYSLNLDRAVTLKDGVEFIIEVTNPDGSVSERGISSVTSDAQGRAIVALTNPLEFTPDPAVVWQISGDIVPQLFRIVTITESQPHIYDVTGLQYEPSKYAAVDNGAPVTPEPISEFPNIVLPPTNLAVRESQYMSNGSARESLTLSWTAGQAFNSIGYYVTIVRPTGEVVNMPRTASTSVDLLDAGPGDYRFIVVAIGLNGRTSLPAELEYTASGWAGVTAPSVTGLQVKGGGATFRGRSCTMEWSRSFPNGQAPYDTQCVAYVYDISTNALLHREVLPAGAVEFTYDYNVNVNEGGPRRTFRVAVTAMTPDGREGAPASLAVSNPAPDKATPTLTWTTESVVVKNTLPTDPDYAGFLIWMSKVQGFTPTDATVTVDSTSTNEFIKADPGTKYYVRVAAYDAFSKRLVDLNLSDEVSVTTNNFPIDTTGPDQPTGLVLTTATEVSAAGIVTASITATWNPVGSDNLSQYEFELAEGDGIAATTSWMRNNVAKGVNTYTWHGVKPGQLYASRVRGVNASGYWGAYSTIVTITSAKNTNKPGAITGFSATANYSAAYLKWTNPTDLDLDYVEVWVGSNSAPASLLQKVAAPQAFYFDNSLATLATQTYWVRPVNTSGTTGDFVGPQSATLPQLSAVALANNIIDETKIAAGLEVPKRVDALPTTGNYEDRLAVYQGQLYRYTGGQWTNSVPAPAITGYVTAAQIQSLNATQIAGTLTSAQIASIDAAKVVGQLVNTQIAAVDAAKISGQLTDSQILGIAATKVSGQLTNAQIAALDANKITGQVVASQLADNAVTQAKLASDLSAVGIVSSLPNPSGYTGPKVVLYNGKVYRLVSGAWTAGVDTGDLSGQVTAAQIVSLNATQIAGTLSDGQLAAISASKLVGQVVDSQVASMSASKLAGQIQTAQIANQAITAALFAANTAPIGVVSSLPSVSGYTGPQLVLNTSDNKVYRYTTGGWVTSVASSDISGTLAAAQIASVNASAVTGSLTASQIGAVNAAVIAGQLADSQLASGINAAKVSGALSNASLAASALTGSITSGQIADLAATKLTGQITTTQITDGSVSTAKVAAGAISAGKIAAGAVTTSKLAIVSQNMAFNPDASQGTRGLTVDGNMPGAGTITVETFWVPTGMLGFAVGSSATAATINAVNRPYWDITSHMQDAAGNLSNYPITAGVTYEFSAAISPHRCSGRLYVTFFNSAGTFVAHGDTANRIVNQGVNTGTPYANWPKSTLIITAPAGAASCVVSFRMDTVTGDNPFLFVSAFMMAATTAGATETSPYIEPGATIIDGANIVTNSLNANRIVANSITAAQIQAGTITGTQIAGSTITGAKIAGGTITGGNIVGGTLTGDKIAGSTITGGNIAAGTIQAGNIAAGTITAGQIAAGTITGGNIAAGTIQAGNLAANTITAGQIASGTITSTQIAASTIQAGNIAAGAVTASKLTISSQNLVFNADFGQGTLGWTLGNGDLQGATLVYDGLHTAWSPAGMTAYGMRATETPTGGSYCDVTNGDRDAAGNAIRYPVTANARYEVSAYLSTHRCTGYLSIIWFDSNGNYITEGTSNQIVDVQQGWGAPLTAWNAANRAVWIGTAPSNATSCDLRVRMSSPWKSGGAPYVFTSGMMFAQCATTTQNEASPYVDPSVTVISGGSILTNSITATQIAAATITGGLIAAGTIQAGNLAANTITAGQIAANTITGSNLSAGTLTAREIAANSITTNKLTVANREINIVGLAIRFVSATSRIEWDAGTIFYRADDNSMTSAAVAGNGFTVSGNAWYSILWYKGRTYLDYSTDINTGASDPNWVTIATYDNTGRYLAVNYGPTMIDGAGIITNSITASNIKAGTITGDRISGGTITGSLIAGGTITGSLIAARTISAGNIVTGTLTGNEIAARTINAGNLVAGTITATEIAGRTITANQISAGTLTANELAAGSITTSKLAITTGNIAFNGDLAAGTTNGFSVGTNNWNGGSITLGIEANWVANGMRGIYATSGGGAGTNSYFDVTHQRADVNGNLSGYPCNPGQLYEVSCYYTCHRCRFEMYLIFRDASNNWVGTPIFVHPGGEFGKAGGAMKDYPRASIIAAAPSNATNFVVILRGGEVSGDNPYIFPFGFMYAAAAPGATEASPYVPPSLTTISGGQILTGSIGADKIVTRSLTAGQIAAGTLTATEIAGGTITGDRIAGNTITGGNLNAGTITAREIASNAITTQKLTIANRELNLAGFNFRINSTSGYRIEWDNGTIWYRADDNSIQSVNIAAGSFATGGNWYTLLWYKGRGNLDWSGDINTGTYDNNWVTLAVYSGGTQFYVNYGSTLLDGDRIITNSLNANRIVAGSITASQIAGDTITGAQIAANAIGASEISAGAIVADKIGIGLNSTNQLWNSDFLAGTPGQAAPNVVGYVSQYGSPYCGINFSGPVWQPPGMGSLQMSLPGTPPSGQIYDTYLGSPAVDGSKTNRIPVQANKKYEISGYVSAHRCAAMMVVSWYDGSGNQISGYIATNAVTNFRSNGPLSQWARCTGFITSPGNAAYAQVSLRMQFNGGDEPYNFWTGLYFAPAKTNQSEFSDWAPGSYTVISGGAISARTISADRIIAGSITAGEIAGGTITGDRIAGNTITGANIAANSIYADKIQIGGGNSLTTWLGGPNNTQINGGYIAANTIRANKLAVGARGINITGLNIRYVVANRQIQWDAGTIYWQNDDGGVTGTSISGGSFTVSGGDVYSIVWYKGKGNLDYSTDINYAQNNQPDWVTIATYDNGTGLSVQNGSTIIDGARIVTNSITATQIAARTIQASNIAAGTLTATEIAAGSITADKITSGTIAAGSLLYMGDGRMRFECNNGVPRMVITDGSNLRVLIGQVRGFAPRGGDWGVCIWDNQNNYVAGPDGVNGNSLWVRSLNADRLAANSITANELSAGQLITNTAQIGTANVATLNLQGGAVSQLVAANNGSGQSVSVTLYVRAGAKVRISGQRIGNPSAAYQQSINTGALRIRRDGNDILAVPANYMLSWNSQVSASNKILLGHYISVIDTPGEGNHTYEVNDDNNASVQGVYIEVTELAR